MQAEPWFGINTAQVQIFLDELAELDLDRAIEVWNSYAAARDKGYDEALEAADAVAAKQRTDAWFRARQAAATLARERLGEPAAMGEIVDALATVAGSLVIRDLLSRHDFRLLQLPWTRREGDAGLAVDDDVADPAAAVAGVAGAAVAVSGAARAAGRAAIRSGRILPAPVRIAIVATTVVVLAVLTRPAGENTDISFGGPPRGSIPSELVFPDPSDAASPLSTSPSSPAASATHAPSPSPSRPPGHGATPPPATHPPTAGPTPTPIPTLPPSPTPNPTPTAPTICTVISLLDVSTVKAQEKWAAAGFTGTVTFSPDVPPQYRIVWQSLAIGAKVTCTHGITVSDHAP